MLYLFAIVGMIAVAVLLWRMLGDPRQATATAPPRTRPQPVAPDDDPDFLRKLGEQNRQDRRDRKDRGDPA